MKVLLITNQKFYHNKPGNPIVHNLFLDLKSEQLVEDVKILNFTFNFKTYLNLISSRNFFDVIHVNFGGFYAFIVALFFLGDKSKRIITFHGTDIHGQSGARFLSKLYFKVKLNCLFSVISTFLYEKIGFVSSSLQNHLRIFKNKQFIHRLSVNYDRFKLIDKLEAKKYLGLNLNKKYILFSSISSNPVKRFFLAKEIVDFLNGYELLLMTNISNKDVPYYISASECTLITSISEGSPNIVRESLALNRPVYSFDVGDVNYYVNLTKKSKIINGDSSSCSEIIKSSLDLIDFENTRDDLRKILSSKFLIKELILLYQNILDE